MLAVIFANIESTFHFHPFQRAMRCGELGRPGVLRRLAGFRLPLRSRSRSARADDSASATKLLWRSCEHQGIADTHAAASRAQIDDLVAVMTFNGVDGHARQSACFFQVDNTLKFNPTRLDTIGWLCSVTADFALYLGSRCLRRVMLFPVGSLPLVGTLLIDSAQRGVNAQEPTKAGRICEAHKSAFRKCDAIFQWM
jgi:hypothetical protein